MVQKYQSPVRVYEYPWELVMAAYERRWPTCKFIPILQSSDTIFEEKSDNGARHVIERRCKMKVDVPYLLRKVAGVDHILFVQRNTLDRRARTLDIEAWNETFENRIKVREHCLYTAHPDNANWTAYTQEASLEIVSFFGFESAVEKLAIKQYTANIQKSKEILLHFIDELASEGITYIPTYDEEHGGGGNVTSTSDTLGGGADSSMLPVGSSAVAIAGTNTSGGGGVVTASGSGYKSKRSDSIRMEENYISKCLGLLDPVQESSLIQLKQWLEEHHKLDKIPNDAHLVRFLRARNFDTESTTKMLCKSLMWRKQNGVDRLRTSWHAPEVALHYFPGGWLASSAHDREGRPIYILRVGQMDIKGLLKSMGAAELEKFIVYTCEEGLEKYVEATRITGHPVSSAAVIVDLYGLSTRHLWRPGLQFLRQLFLLLNENYPETLGRLWVVRAPRFFPVLWTLVSPFIDEETHKKLVVYAGNTHLNAKDGLEHHIDRQYIPPFLLEKTDFSTDTGGVTSSQSSHALGVPPLEPNAAASLDQRQQQPVAASSSTSFDTVNAVAPTHNNSSSQHAVAETAATPTQPRRKRSLKATLSGSQQQQQNRQPSAEPSARASTPNTPTGATGALLPVALDAHIPQGGLVPRTFYLIDAESVAPWDGGATASATPNATTSVEKTFSFPSLPSSSTAATANSSVTTTTTNTTTKQSSSDSATGGGRAGSPTKHQSASSSGTSAASSLAAESGIGSSCYSSPASSSSAASSVVDAEAAAAALLSGSTPTRHSSQQQVAALRPSSSSGGNTSILGHTTKSWVPMHFTNRLQNAPSSTTTAAAFNHAMSGGGGTQSIAPQFEPLYVRVLLSRTGEHEVPLEIPQPGSIITWDFDVLGSNCRFSILYLYFDHDDGEKNQIVRLNSEHDEIRDGNRNDEAAARQQPSTSASAIERQKQQEKLEKFVHQYYEQLQQRQADKQKQNKAQHDNAGSMPYQERGDVEAVRFIERVDERLPHLKVEKIYEKELCKNGDSIQGTCNAMHAGIYVLRWRQMAGDSSCVPSTSLMATTFDSLKFSVGSKSCRLMYSVEVITRDAFKGSMNSLHSVASAFTSMNLQPTDDHSVTTAAAIATANDDEDDNFQPAVAFRTGGASDRVENNVHTRNDASSSSNRHPSNVISRTTT